MTQQTIPTFSLYGEQQGPSPAGFAHIETIASRSSLHDWEIKPHRHDRAMQLLFVREGAVEIVMDGTRRSHGGPCYIAVPVGAVHGFRFAPETRGHVLTLSQDFLSRAHAPDDPLLRLMSFGGHGVLTPEAARRVAWLAEELLTLSRDWPVDQALFHILAEGLVRSLPVEAQGDLASDPQLARFRRLVELHLRDHQPIDFYAQALGTTVRTLTRHCRDALGTSPLGMIHRRLALEAQRMLLYTNASIVQISAELGFSDPSYFSRFYRRMTGKRPQAERRAVAALSTA